MGGFEYACFSLSGTLRHLREGFLQADDILRIFCNFDVARAGIAHTLVLWARPDLEEQWGAVAQGIPLSAHPAAMDRFWDAGKFPPMGGTSARRLKGRAWEAGYFHYASGSWIPDPEIDTNVDDWLALPVVEIPDLDLSAARKKRDEREASA